MKQVITTFFLPILILFNMESQAQGFKKIETEKLTLDVFNASENSFGVASVIVSGKTDAILILPSSSFSEAPIPKK